VGSKGGVTPELNEKEENTNNKKKKRVPKRTIFGKRKGGRCYTNVLSGGEGRGPGLKKSHFFNKTVQVLGTRRKRGKVPEGGGA